MTYEQAVEKSNKYEHLIGQVIDDEHEISNLVIVPSNRKFDGEMVNRIYWDKPFGDIISAHNDFTIIVLYDLYTKFRATGILFKDDLDNVIQKLGLSDDSK